MTVALWQPLPDSKPTLSGALNNALLCFQDSEKRTLLWGPVHEWYREKLLTGCFSNKINENT
jgi:hypothetical protein